MITCLWLLAQDTMRAASLPFLKTGIKMAISNAMMAITTSNSINVKPADQPFIDLEPSLLPSLNSISARLDTFFETLLENSKPNDVKIISQSGLLSEKFNTPCGVQPLKSDIFVRRIHFSPLPRELYVKEDAN